MSDRKHTVTFEFPSEDSRDSFLAMFCDGGGECHLLEMMEDEGFCCSFKYGRAFRTESPVVECVEHEGES